MAPGGISSGLDGRTAGPAAGVQKQRGLRGPGARGKSCTRVAPRTPAPISLSLRHTASPSRSGTASVRRSVCRRLQHSGSAARRAAGRPRGSRLCGATHQVERSFHYFHRPRSERWPPEGERRLPGSWRSRRAAPSRGSGVRGTETSGRSASWKPAVGAHGAAAPPLPPQAPRRGPAHRAAATQRRDVTRGWFKVGMRTRSRRGSGGGGRAPGCDGRSRR